MNCFAHTAIVMFSTVSIALSQNPVSLAEQRSVGRSAISAASGTYTESEIVMITNRARVFGDRASGSGSTFCVLNNRNTSGLTPEQLLDRLKPTVLGPDVRRFESVIDITRPITVVAQPGQPALIGTAVISPNAAVAHRTIDVRTVVQSLDINVITKR